MVNWSLPTTDEIAHRRAGGRRKFNRQRQVNAFWLGIEVWDLGRQGLSISEIATELDISPATAWRHYTKWFGKRRPMIARAKALAVRIEAESARLDSLLAGAKSQPVNREKLSEMLAKLKARNLSEPN